MKKRIFITHIVPKELIEKLDVSPAGNYFSYNLISGNLFDEVISLIPTNIKSKIHTKDRSQIIKFIQVRFFPHNKLFKPLNIFLENLQLIFSIKKHSSVWFYNLTIHSLFAFLILKYLRNINSYIIVLDYTPTDKKCTIQYFILKCINHANGIIELIPNNRFNNKNKKIISGVVPMKNTYQKQKSINYVFLLSGILVNNRNPKLILDIFSNLPQYTLNISGIVEDEAMFLYYSKQYSNIHYHGYLPYNDYINLIEEATFCINSRDTTYVENYFNFPSKMIEYLLYNKIVISTMLYTHLEDINYLYVHSEEQVFELFKSIETMDKELLLREYANQSENIIEKMGTSHWLESMIFLENN